jgi:hypothetical protein
LFFIFEGESPGIRLITERKANEVAVAFVRLQSQKINNSGCTKIKHTTLNSAPNFINSLRSKIYEPTAATCNIQEQNKSAT